MKIDPRIRAALTQERWLFADDEFLFTNLQTLRPPVSISPSADDEFIVNVPDPYDYGDNEEIAGVIVNRKGESSNRFSDGTIGVPQLLREKAEQQEEGFSCRTNCDANTWMDVLVNSKGKLFYYRPQGCSDDSWEDFDAVELPAWHLVRRNDDLDDWAISHEYGLKSVYRVYLYDHNQATCCAELTPSRELNFVDLRYELNDGVELTDEQVNQLDEIIQNAWSAGEDIIYVHCHEIDAVDPEEKDNYRHIDQNPMSDKEVVDLVNEEFDYEEAKQEVLEYFRCNCML